MFIFNITGIQSVFTERSNCKTLSQFFLVFTDWDNVTLTHLLLLLESLLSVMSSFVFPFLAHLAKGHVSFCHHLASVVRLSVRTSETLIFSSETTGPIAAKLCWNGICMALFQNCVRWSRLPTKMAAKLRIEKRGGEISIVHCCYNTSQNELKF
jgi:hypothetical protein